MDIKLINVGYGNFISSSRIIAIIGPDRAPVKRMVQEAEALGADAIVNIRYASAAVMQSAAEVMAYGTAVKFK